MTEFRLLSYVEENGSSRAGLLVQDMVFDLEAAVEAVGRRPGFQGNSVLSTLEAWDLARLEIDNIVDAIFARTAPALEALGRPLVMVSSFIF